ncbi:ABC transporter ATP-binding protein [Halalkalibacillus sediminis]|uniref:ABC transporter ATP-binding protein n=1 Tax=Halalkalibacillus sediminis TaxID=2018042 RepID=A0A2I0QRS8_9BACI|nr:ABC transporter ATP-binding protein [Halalkalibacillus sediminis]PKR77044.1 ABC transporter ATP-binding protein [Halalkalibacillus sediminis]
MLQLEQVSKKIEGQSIVQNVTIEITEGQCVGLIGPNGAGKSSLIKLISGLEEPSAGSIYLKGKSVNQWKTKKIAKSVAVLTQEGLAPYPISVYDAVLMGRYPHLGFFQRESQEDYDKVDHVLEITGLKDFKSQMLDTLSGGERQRVAIAKAMVQEPELLLLDEPTTFLDIGHQLNVLRLVQEWQERENLTVVMVLHDLNLAAQFCEKLILMNHGEVVKEGSSEDIIAEETLRQVYHATPEIIRHPKSNIPQILLSPQ